MQRRPRKTRIGRRSTHQNDGDHWSERYIYLRHLRAVVRRQGRALHPHVLPAFLSGMRGKSEEYVTYYDHLQGDSPGGYKAVPVGSPPGSMPVYLGHRGGVGSDIRFKSERSFTSRDQKIVRHEGSVARDEDPHHDLSSITISLGQLLPGASRCIYP